MAECTSRGTILRVARDVADLQQSANLSLATAVHETDARFVRALIIGPADTPYEHGFFEFDFKFPDDYPMSSPKVKSIITNDGKTRFNPNVYSNGKVCLSILGTWPAESSESWSSILTLESVLICIQSLLGESPYRNEPGFEQTPRDDLDAIRYARKIRHETLRIAVIERLEWTMNLAPPEEDSREMIAELMRTNRAAEKEKKEKQTAGYPNSPNTDYASVSSNSQSSEDSKDDFSDRLREDPDLTHWDPFCDLIKRRFFLYHDTYVQRIQAAMLEQSDGVVFSTARFECSSNGMKGNFRYKDLRGRIKRILNALEEEHHGWIDAGLEPAFANCASAKHAVTALARAQELSTLVTPDRSSYHVELVHPLNPIHWQLTVVGGLQTNLAGGLLYVHFVIPPDFPESWPRAWLGTVIHHRNVNSFGWIYYEPAKPDSIQSHIEGIIAALDDKDPKYDPRTVINPQVAAEFWSSDGQQRRNYIDMLRATVCASGSPA